MIWNHQSAKLSALDLQFARAVPPGGNWKNIPEDVPSARLAQIRESCAAGKGSRSTYYGRLLPDAPSYTIGTYYTRPGNGCFLHPDASQDRTISHREAARLQSFPDDFIFHGSQRAVCQQIGNAVPPLLAMQIAEALGAPGDMVDVFAGCGGLSLGFKWQGWTTLAAADFDKSAVAAFRQNVSPLAVVGDMNDDQVIEYLVTASKERCGARPLALVGGPPCQGFSTGGNKRSEADVRNHLHARYSLLLEKMKPDLFVFENVLGLLSMSGGTFLQRIMRGFDEAGYDAQVWKMNAAEFGVPQRRVRVVIVGVRRAGRVNMPPRRPAEWCSLSPEGSFVTQAAVTVAEAISDLPALIAGEDGSQLDYSSAATCSYQALMRGELSPAAYLAETRRRNSRLAA
ncbi:MULTISPECIES: DNA (cytosine-5-)-methyltransferase [unclassified Sphingobium]|uniref:DNA (cytosine-5-)-methyltransferase n=1 Tax=unclassified Sphingobium TaxID=2611147 RepID=UPI0022255A9E|nr:MULTISPECIES: DNA (cytosine-5-)-methyltransferase [unclassified Sphingobium]MCW2396148.1 DNA (cytosine-5)-methyltransferase 1 [Sphingobium sp. B8D3B]MCW2419664.1 DNA (cytosine-5)-methyltransferase 1 [Sphingobium sp. B8D3C]